MPSTFIKTIEQSDYDEVVEETKLIAEVSELITKHGARCDIGHPARFIEYGYALKALKDLFNTRSSLKILDVGAGWSPLGPCLSYYFHHSVAECDTDPACEENRVLTNQWLLEDGRKPISWVKGTAETVLSLINGYGVKEKFDAVFCVSVMEHVDRNYELQMWQDLQDLVVPGGLLYVTCDVMGKPGPHVFDNLRITNYTTHHLSLIYECRLLEMKSLKGEPDFSYKGDMVHDYSFMIMGMEKGVQC